MLDEDFEIIVPVGASDSVFDAETNSYRKRFIESVLSDLRSEGIDTNGADTRVASHGYGADGLSLLVVLGLLTTAFLQGKKIEENLDAWIRLGRRFHDAVWRLRKRGLGARVSEPVAAALAVAEIAQRAPKGLQVKVLTSLILPVSNRSLAAQKAFRSPFDGPSAGWRPQPNGRRPTAAGNREPPAAARGVASDSPLAAPIGATDQQRTTRWMH